MNLKRLQNGSDIRGVALEGVINEPVTLTHDEAYALARGFQIFLQEKTGKEVVKIAVGHDSRLSKDMMKNAICTSLKNGGCHVVDCGLSSTPSMFMSTIFDDFKTDGAIMITASHLPFNRNGMKFFDQEGGLDKKDISSIIEYAFKEEITKDSGTIVEQDLITTYSQFLVDKIRKEVNHPTNYDFPLTGMKIVVDAGNGAGGFYATQVLNNLGADTQGSQFLDPDGTFPNHIPNPEDKDAMEAICSAVKINNADLGLIFDTDVDRSSAVDKYGNEINRNAIVALAAALVCESYPNTTVVTDSVTSDELSVFIEEELQGKHHRFKRGYKNVINEAVRLNNEGIDAQLAIETSGHAALKENYFLDDGAYLATKIVIKAAKMHLEGKSLDTLISALNHPLEDKEIRISITCDDFQTYGDEVLEKLNTYGEHQDIFNLAPVNYEGLRFNFDEANGNGWMLLRKSLHDPILPLNMESNTKDGCLVLAKHMFEFLKSFEYLDVSTLEEFIK